MKRNFKTKNASSSPSSSPEPTDPAARSSPTSRDEGNTRIRRRSSPPTRIPRPHQVVEDMSSLSLPTLQQHRPLTEESRNDRENRQFTASQHSNEGSHVPYRLPQHLPLLDTVPIPSVTPFAAIAAAATSGATAATATEDDCLSYDRSSPAALAAKAEQINEEARREAARRITREGRPESSSARSAVKRNDNNTAGGEGANDLGDSQASGLSLSPTSLNDRMRAGVASYIASQSPDMNGDTQSFVGSTTTTTSTSTSSSMLDGPRRRQILQNALDRAAQNGRAAAARAVSEGELFVVARSSSMHDGRTAVQASASARDDSSEPQPYFVPLKTGKSDRSKRKKRAGFAGRVSDEGDTDNSNDRFSLHRTRSADEVLESVKSLVDEAQAQIESRSPRHTPTPLSPHHNFPSIETAASSQNHHPQILSPTKTPTKIHAMTPPRLDKVEQRRENGNVIANTMPLPPNTTDTQEFFNNVSSPSPSELALYDDLETAVKRLPLRLRKSCVDDNGDPLPRERMLQTLDGMYPSPVVSRNPSMKSNQSDLSHFEDDDDDEQDDDGALSVVSNKSSGPLLSNSSAARSTIKIRKAPKQPIVIKSMEVAQQTEEKDAIGSLFNFFIGATTGKKETKDGDDAGEEGGESDIEAGVFPGLACVLYDDLPATTSSLVPQESEEDATPPSYAQLVKESSLSRKVDPRMPEWVENKFMIRQDLPKNGTYQLGESKTIIVHEILRGNWTWCTAWSPDGTRLAVATENHHLAVVDTTTSAVWRVRHDLKATGPAKKGTTHSIRSIAWGENFIAIGGTGNAVSIIAPTEPYPILHTVTPTGFVGSMDWLPGTNKLLVGSRLGKAILLDIWANDEENGSAVPFSSKQLIREIQSTVLHMTDRGKAWVNAVQFSPGGKFFAAGDSLGILGIYSLKCQDGDEDLEITNIANFKLEDSILDIEWAADGDFIYAGGEDFAITIISTEYWEPVHRIARDRWVQFISSSLGSTHVAVGGVTSEVSLLDVSNGWDNVINISLKGLVPLSAKWHPQDQYLVLTGQNDSILAIETTNARHISGHFLRSFHAVLAIAFSPDGRMAAIGNEMGVVTIFELTSTTFASAYEMVVDCDGSLSIEWSKNGAYLAISATNKVVIVARKETMARAGPPNASGFFVATVVRDLGAVYDVTVDPTSRFVAASGSTTRVLDATACFKNVLEMENGGITLANAWSPDGKWFAAIGRDHSLVIYDSSHESLVKWQSVFTIKMNQPGFSLAWGPSTMDGLQYLVYGGEDKHIYVVEIRTDQRTWENVLSVPRDGSVNDLDWNGDGLVAAAIGNGTVTILDLSYLQTGCAVNEMDYNWQRQALTCFTEIRRNRGKHSMKKVRWLPSAPSFDSLLAIGGTDGELEVIDLTERKRCRGFKKTVASI